MKIKKEGLSLLKKNFNKLLPYKLASYCFAVVPMFISLLLVNYMKELIDCLQIGKQINYLYLPIEILCVLFVIFMAIFQFIFRRTQIVGKNEILVILYNKLMTKKLSFFRDNNSGEIISLINNEAKEVGDWLSHGVLGLFNLFTVLVFNVGLMFYYDLTLALIVCALVFLFYMATKILASCIARLTSESFKVTGVINNFLLETLKSIQIINTLNKHKWFKGKFYDIVYEKRFAIDKKTANINAVYCSIFLILSILLPILVVVIGASLFSDRISVGTLVAFYALTAHIQEPIQNIPQFFSMKRNAASLAENLLPILKEDIDKEANTNKLPEKIDSLRVDINYFSYNKGDKELLKNLNFEIGCNAVVVVKGNSGVGKSTLLDLIMGFIKSKETKITHNNVNLSNVSDKERWQHILFVPQTPLLFEGSLKENLLIGDSFLDEEIKEVIYTVCLEEFLTATKFNCMIGGDFDKISGGQKQRICLARMLLRKPDLLILDEPTSALDSKTSYQVAKRLTKFADKNNMMLLVISHKNDFDNFADAVIEVS